MFLRDPHRTGKSYPTPATVRFYVYQLMALGNINSCELFEIEGHVDEAQLRRALPLALSRHPILNSRVESRPIRSFRYRIADESLPIDLRIARLDSDEPGAVHEALLRNIWSEPVAVGRGRPVRFHLTFTPARSYLQIITTRLYNDARAGYRLAHDIAESYCALEEGRAYDPTPLGPETRDDEELFTRSLPLPRRVRHFLGGLGAIFSDLVHRDGALPLPPTSRGEVDFLKVEFGASTLEALRREAKRRHATVHALLCLAIYNVGKELDPDGERDFRILDNFCLRRFASEPLQDTYGTFSVPYCIRLPARADDDAIVQAVVSRLDTLKSGEILDELYRIRIYTALSRFSPLRLSIPIVGRFVAQSNLVLSNPGPIPYELSRFGRLAIADFYNFSQLFPPSRVMLIFSTFRGVLRAVVVYDRNAVPRGIEHTVVQPLRRQLDRLSNMGANATGGDLFA